MDNNDRSLIPLPDGSLANMVAGTKRILSAMVEETLALGRDEAVGQTAKFRIGDYNWCEPDYRQILLWAEALKMEPLTLIKKLVAGEESKDVATKFQDGRMLSLSWNWEALPLSDFQCVEGITIEKLRIYRADMRSIALCMPSLCLFECYSCQIRSLTLSHIPNLSSLICGGNQFTELDLSYVPNLTRFECSFNCLIELDLSHVPKLTRLNCAGSKFSELDLSHLPSLINLDCSHNNLAELDLSRVPNLTNLDCHGNQLTLVWFK